MAQKIDQAFIDQQKKRLLEEQTQLKAKLARVAKKDPKTKGDYDAKFPQYTDKDETESGDFDDSAHEVQDYADNIGVENQLEVRLQKVEAALARIEKGEYGKCVDCDCEECSGDMHRDRLEADAAAEKCLHCGDKK